MGQRQRIDTQSGMAATGSGHHYTDQEQILTFSLSGELYGVDILSVEEIRGLEAWTRIPNAPAFVRGVVNLRGAIVPVIDLRERFALSTESYGESAVIVVLRCATKFGSRALGVIADAVSDVHNAEHANAGVTPEFGSDVNTEFISRLVTFNNRMIMLLDAEKLLNHPDITGIKSEETIM